MTDLNFEKLLEVCPMEYIYGKLEEKDFFVIDSSIKELRDKFLNKFLKAFINFKELLINKEDYFFSDLQGKIIIRFIKKDLFVFWINKDLLKGGEINLSIEEDKILIVKLLENLNNNIEEEEYKCRQNRDIIGYKDILEYNLRQENYNENKFCCNEHRCYRSAKNDKMFYEVLNYLDDVVIIKEGEKTIFVNNAFEKLYGLNCKEVYKEKSMIVKLDRIHEEDKYKFKNIDFDNFFMENARIIRSDNEIRTVLFRANSIKNEKGESLRRIIVINDITDSIEESHEMEKLRIEFFANISHEFKTPVNLIYSALQLLEFKLKKSPGKEDEGYVNYIKVAKQNIFRLLKLINNLIDSTKLESGFFNINIKNHDIVSCVEDITLSICEFAKNNKINITFDTEEEERIMAFDLNHLERILLNLLSNSIKFNKENGKIEVSISFKEESVFISIKDSGIGIPKDKMDRLFDRFKKINNRLTKVNEGSGIGLYIANELVKINGGEMRVKSELGEGTEFLIIFPIRKVESSGLEDININFLERESREDLYKIELSDIY